MSSSNRMFAALVKYWRDQRGMSQLDLALFANVSSKHISFLETGRSAPSMEMVLLLADVLDVPLRNRNDMLRAANFEACFPEPGINEIISGYLGLAVETMLKHHEPHPMIIFDRLYNCLRANQAGGRLFDLLWPNTDEHNLLKLMICTSGREIIENWETFASISLRRLQREVLFNGNDAELRALLDILLTHPDVPVNWRQPMLNDASVPMLPVRLRLKDWRLSFLMSVTAFDAPQNITLNELRIESWFPLDDITREFCVNELGQL